MKTAAYPYQPAPERGTLPCFLLALFMHLLLGVLLYFGVHWRSAAPNGVEAELWEAIPEAATQAGAVTKPAPATTPAEKEADISLKEQQRKAVAAAREQARVTQREARNREETAREEARRQREAANNAQHQGELARLQALAGRAGATAATGSTTGPSSGYADRVRQRVKPNIIFAAEISGNPAAVVAVQMAPDGSLLSARLVKSSGNAAWDSAVLRAVSRSDPLPRDESGIAPASITITFKPKDQAPS